MKRSLLVLALMSVAMVGCSKHEQAYQQPMVQQCGVNPNTQNQECVLVPQSQVQQAQQAQQQVVQQPVYAQPAPVYAQPAPVVVHDGGNAAGNLATGMLLGHMMSNGGGGRNDTTVNKTVVNKTVIVKNYAAPAAPVPQAAPAAPSYVPPAPRPVVQQTMNIPAARPAPAPAPTRSVSFAPAKSTSNFGGFKKK